MATLLVYPGIIKIHKNLPGEIHHIFPYQNIILSLWNRIQNFFDGGHPNGLWKFTKTFPGTHLMISQNFSVIGCTVLNPLSTNKQTNKHIFIAISNVEKKGILTMVRMEVKFEN